jgi:hypothetical protein
MAQLMRILGEIWLSMLSLFIIIFALIIIVTEGFGALCRVFSPFKLWDWDILILALPGMGLLILAKALRK